MSLNFHILQKSFAPIRPHGEKFASRFYYNLFNDYPEFTPLFANTNMEQQNQKLIQTLVLVIYNSASLAYLSNILNDLGERHVRYAVIPEHYPIIGEVLLKTLGEYLGEDWTPEVKQVWADAYSEIVDLMLEGTKSHEEALKFENEIWPSTNQNTVDSSSIEPPVTTSSLNDYEDISNLDNVSQSSRNNDYEDLSNLNNLSQSSHNPDMANFIPTQPPATKSRLNLKLIVIIFAIASLLGVGLFYYNFRLAKEEQNITTPKE
ncbi:MAG: globin family protein [Brasilonema sp.]